MQTRSMSSLAVYSVLLLLTAPAHAAVFNVANGDVAGLKNAIITANTNDQIDTIVLAAGGTYTLTATDNTTHGPNGLPIIADDLGGADLTIAGNGAAIRRSTASGTPQFRIFYISTGAAAVLNSMVIANGQSSGSTFPDYNGGGIFNDHGTLALTGCTLSGNRALPDGHGGGIFNYGFSDGNASLTISNCTFSGNGAGRDGGAINNYDGTATLTGSTLNSNVALPNGSGGAISNIVGPLTVTNCTISGNSADTGVGGAIYNQAATLIVQNCTLSGNRADQGGQCIWNTAPSSGNASLTLGNTILQKGAAFTSTNLRNFFNNDGTASITSHGYNLSSDNGGGFLTGPNDQINTDPQFDPSGLQDNGGPTKTMALLPGSPALDKGKDLAGTGQDQRGAARPFDAPAIAPASDGSSTGDNSDIGAFEAGDMWQSGGSFVVTTTADHSDGVCGDDCSLRDAIRAANAMAGANTITFASGVTGTIALQPALGELQVTGDTTIGGPGARLLKVSGSFTRVFRFSGGTSTVFGLEIRGGSVIGVSSTSGELVYGGGVLNQATLTLSDCTLSGNVALGGDSTGTGGNGGDGSGGAIANFFVLTLDRCTFLNNGAAGGLGGANPGDVTFGGKGGAGRGGAIFNGGTLTLGNCTFFHNSAGGEAGGDGHFGGSGGDGSGGAVFNQGTMTMTACTLNGNSATGGGGGKGSNFINDGGAGAGRGGGLANTSTSSDSTVQNTISAANTGQNGGGADVDGDFTSGGYNLIGDVGTATGFTASGDQVGGNGNPILDAKLGPLQNNGGPTDTMALLPGSPAQDQGKNFGLTTDQRGSLRPVDDPAVANASNGTDIGAFEADVVQSGSHLLVNTNADHDDGVCTLGDCTLREAIHSANAQTGADTITFKRGVTGAIGLQAALGELAVTDSVTIKGPGARVLAVRTRAGNRLFSFTSGTNTMSGLTIRNGVVIGASQVLVAGGGIFNQATLTVSDCAFSDNQVFGSNNNSTGGVGGDAQGGAIANYGTLTLNRCTFNGNSVTGGHGGPNPTFGSTGGTGGAGGGGAVFNATHRTLTITNCTFYGNSAGGGVGGSGYFGGAGGTGSGGGVFNQGTLTVTNCTLSGNSATGGAGGPGTNRGGRAGKGSGGLAAGGGSSTITNTISAGNSGNGGGNVDVDGAFTSGGANLIGDVGTATGFTGPGDQVGGNGNPVLDAKLGPLSNNGGLTDTMALLPGSPAINMGNNTAAPTKDQRSYARLGRSDIGAFEFNGKPPSSYRVDALIKKNNEDDTAFALNNVYQLTPSGKQIETQSRSIGATAIYQVKIENDTTKARTFAVQASQSTEANWSVVYKRGTTDITPVIESATGYKTGVLAPGASEIITIAMTPGAGASSSKSTTLRVFLGGTDTVIRDVVKAITTVAASGTPAAAPPPGSIASS